MQRGILQKSWVSPITAVSFVVVAVTGVLMLLHIRGFSLKSLHEWMGLTMAVAGTLHLVLNWRTFLAYFERREAQVALVTACLLALVLFFKGGETGHGPGHGGGQGPHPGGEAQSRVPGR